MVCTLLFAVFPESALTLDKCVADRVYQVPIFQRLITHVLFVLHLYNKLLDLSKKTNYGKYVVVSVCIHNLLVLV